MPRPIRSIEIYLPLEYNDGRPIEEAKFIGLQRQLLNYYGGVPSTQRQFPLEGLWKSGKRVFQHRVAVFTVMEFREKTDFEVVRHLERLKARLKKKFQQLDVLITVQELLAV